MVLFRTSNINYIRLYIKVRLFINLNHIIRNYLDFRKLLLNYKKNQEMIIIMNQTFGQMEKGN